MLVSAKGEVKLADLGLSVQLPSGSPGALHQPVCTLLYQSPEQLFGTPSGYGARADVWGLGCILAELLTGEPLFCAAKTFKHLVEIVMSRYGEEAFNQWPEVRSSKYFINHQHSLRKVNGIRGYFKIKRPNLDSLSLDLLESLLSLNPEFRPSASDVLQHSWFTTSPLPSEGKGLFKKSSGT